jgi:hypothetical protein
LRSTNRKRSPRFFSQRNAEGPARAASVGVRLIRWTKLPEFDAVVIANNQVLRNNGQRFENQFKVSKEED